MRIPDKSHFSLTIPLSGLCRRQISAHPSFVLIDGIGICIYDNLLPGDRKNNDHQIHENLVRGYKKYDENIFSDIGDHASLIIADFSKNKFLISSDKVGHFTYYFAPGKDSVIVSNDTGIFFRSLFPEISRESFIKYFLSGYIGGENTIFSGIRKVPPGCYLALDRGKLSVKRYHCYRTNIRSYDKKLIKASIQSRLRDCVRVYASGRNVGLMLSGGYDSTLLCRMAAEESLQLNTFTIGIKSVLSSAVSRSRKIASLFETRHHEIVFTLTEYVSIFADVFRYFDEPAFDMDMPVIFRMLSEIPKDINFIFHGFGSDELFGDRLKTQGGNFNRQSFCAFAGKKLPQELILHDKICLLHNSRLIFPFLAHPMLELALSMPLGLKKGKNLLRSISPELNKIHSESCLPDVRIPSLVRKALIMHYMPQVEKSRCIIGLLGRKTFDAILRRNVQREILLLIVFHVWFKKRFSEIN